MNNGGTATSRLKQAGIKRFERRRAKQLVAKAQHHAIVLARILVAHGGDPLRRDFDARLLHQRRVQRALVVARRRDRREFRPHVVSAQIIVGDSEPPVGAARKQAVAATAPEIGHRAP